MRELHVVVEITGAQGAGKSLLAERIKTLLEAFVQEFPDVNISGQTREIQASVHVSKFGVRYKS